MTKAKSDGITRIPSITLAGAVAGMSFTVYTELDGLIDGLKVAGGLHFMNSNDKGVLMYDGSEFYIPLEDGRLTYKVVNNQLIYQGFQPILVSVPKSEAVEVQETKEEKPKQEEVKQEPVLTINDNADESIRAYLEANQDLSAPARFVLEKISFAGIDSLEDVIPFFNYVMGVENKHKETIMRLDQLVKENVSIFQQRYNESDKPKKFVFNVKKLKEDYTVYIEDYEDPSTDTLPF